MKLSVTPEAALRFTKMNVYLVSSWPLSKSISRVTKIWFSIRWWIAFISLLLLFLPLTNSVFVFRKDSLVMVKAACQIGASGQALLKLLICRYQSDRLQFLHQEMEVFIKNADSLEKKFLQKYIEKSGFFHVFVSVSMWAVCLAFIIEPILLSHPYPTDTAYPFVVKSESLRIALYLQQVMALFFVAAALTIDFQVATLLWFTCVKFEVLGHHFREVSSERELVACIKKHQQVLWYAKEVKNAVHYITLATIATTTIGVICGCLTLISNQPFSVKLRIANIVGNATSELFIYAWPADNLIQKSQDIGWSVYNSKWINAPISMVRMTMNVIHRSQIPVMITISGVMPSLCLHYYTSFLSTTFSYFTTLRAVYAADETEN
ncbi:GSCOCT00013801001.3-RA-CDS [Cotesia congregata]|uniref:Odorant receptor n=1 Tax=Cotesia congregata TaxID=51543 RepID=A0A8J2MML5_COTCN|nr:GSCOCT00013801001.3-RA-CDS [Cotesia congregata]CAG5098059.1 olfactory receptor 56 [Cotesia congregata]